MKSPSHEFARESLILLVPVACAGILIGALFILDYCRRPGASRFPMVQGVNLDQLAKQQPFVASVEDKTAGTWTNRESASDLPVGNSRYIMVYLKRKDGQKLCVVSENPDTNGAAFLDSLEKGRSYEFPTVLSEWLRQSPQSTSVKGGP
jgi:hypothetical protein